VFRVEVKVREKGVIRRRLYLMLEAFGEGENLRIKEITYAQGR